MSDQESTKPTEYVYSLLCNAINTKSVHSLVKNMKLEAGKPPANTYLTWNKWPDGSYDVYYEYVPGTEGSKEYLEKLMKFVLGN